MERLLGQGAHLQAKERVCGLEQLPSSGIVGLYFSAKWCMPCRQFTPRLAEAYSNIRASGKAFEIIYLSADKDEVQFGEYYAEHPWLALPFVEREKKSEIQRQFGVRGIPALILIDAATGELVNADGRQALQNDWEGHKYPWKPPTLLETVGMVTSSDGKEQSAEKVLEGKYIAFFFCDQSEASASVTAKLLTLHAALAARGANFEVLHVARENDLSLTTRLPWLALHPSSDAAKQDIAHALCVASCQAPALIIAGPDGKTISNDGVTVVMADPHGKEFPWIGFQPSLQRQGSLSKVKETMRGKSCCIL